MVCKGGKNADVQRFTLPIRRKLFLHLLCAKNIPNITQNQPKRRKLSLGKITTNLLSACVIKYQHLSKPSLTPQYSLDSDLVNVLLFLNLNTSHFTSLNVSEGLGLTSVTPPTSLAVLLAHLLLKSSSFLPRHTRVEATKCCMIGITEKPKWKLFTLPP